MTTCAHFREAMRVTDYNPTLGEEIANSITHGVGLLLSLVGLPVLLFTAMLHAGGRPVVGAALFGVTLVLLYAASTLYHALPQPRVKRLFRVLDHSAIYLLIAGTYTPFALGVLRGPVGTSLLIGVWTLAGVGVLLKALGSAWLERVSTLLYLAMGWLIIIAVRPLLAGVPPAGIALLVAGGLSYTIGVIFYARDRLRYFHMVWHLFVLGGSACHFFAVLWYAAPAA